MNEKILKGRSFKGYILYALGDKEAKILTSLLIQNKTGLNKRFILGLWIGGNIWNGFGCLRRYDTQSLNKQRIILTFLKKNIFKLI